MMEHRNGSRIAVSMPVELLHRGQSCGSFESSNIGHGGLLLNGRGALKKGDFLTAKIANNIINGGARASKAGGNKSNSNVAKKNPDTSSKPSDYFQLNVMVVHKSASGVGLMWVDNNIPFFDSLGLMLSSAA